MEGGGLLQAPALRLVALGRASRVQIRSRRICRTCLLLRRFEPSPYIRKRQHSVFSLFLRVLNHAFLVEGGGFEPPKVEPADLQSAPFGRSGTPPEKIKPRILLVQYAAVNRNWMIRRTKIMELVDGIEPPTC